MVGAAAARQPLTEYQALTPEAAEVAIAWSKLTDDKREVMRDLIFMLLLTERRFPWLRRGRPQSETYAQWERRQEQNFAAMVKLGSYPKAK